jgi:catechol 2,3-dioxygenase-like lactoylglutathione lyase family enzyme
MSPLNLTRISHINLYSKNNKRAIRFYRDVLGLRALPRQSDSANWYGFGTKGVVFAIEPEKNRRRIPFKFNKKNPVLVQFKANSIAHLERINKMLERRGVKLLRRSEKKSYGVITNFLDPDGNLIEILYQK